MCWRESCSTLSFSSSHGPVQGDTAALTSSGGVTGTRARRQTVHDLCKGLVPIPDSPFTVLSVSSYIRGTPGSDECNL